MAAEAGGDGRAGIGTRLRSARERKALTILQAAEKMHVDAKILESLEAEDFAALGAPVYARGHLRHYAELVGEQPGELQELYANSNRAAQAQPDLTRISRAQPTSDPSKLVVPAVIVLVGIALVGTVWWLLTLSVDKSRALQNEGQIAANTPGQATVPATDTDAAPAPGTANNREPAPPVPANRSGTAVAAVKTAAKTLAPALAPAGSAPSAAQAKDSELTLKFSSDSWAEVYDASGQRLFYDVGAAASAHTVKGTAPLRVVLGNAAGVAVEFNGKPAAITASMLPDGSAKFSINVHGRAVRATRQADGG